MSTTIDTNIVQMKFDNKQFEEGCKESMSTLEKLKQKINDSKSGNALEGLNKAANGIDLSKLSAGVESIAKRFSTLGIIGMTIISNLTTSAMNLLSGIAGKINDLIVQGGISRAMNIEQAKFQLAGLGIAWEEVSDDIDYAVKGTAYGLDAAAKAASQLIASNVKAGDSMKAALRGISGAAAMTNSEYEDIARIFTTVAGNGRLMADQLNQLGGRGLNAAATLASFFNDVNEGSVEASESVTAAIKEVTGGLKVTEADIRDFTSHGMINFEMFSQAMDTAFGEHAKDANKTFTGVLRNINAAFARIGADFVSPIVQNESSIVLVFQRIIDRIDEARKDLQPLVKTWVEFINLIGKTGQKIAENFDVHNLMANFYNVLHSVFNVFESIYRIILPIKDGFRDIFPKDPSNNLISITQALVNFTDKLKISGDHMVQLRIGFQGIFSVIKLVIDAIKGGIQIIFGMTGEVDSLSDAFFNAIENIGLFLLSITSTIRESKTLSSIFETLKNVIVGFAEGLANAIKSIGGSNSDGITKFADDLKESTGPLEIFGTVFKGVFTVVSTIISTIIPRVIAAASKLGEVIRRLFNNVVDSFGSSSGTAAANILNGGILAILLVKMKNLVGAATGFLRSFTPISDILGQLKDSLFAWQRDLEAGALLKLAGAVAILVGSILLLTGIDDTEIAKATTVISVFMGELIAALRALNGVSLSKLSLSGLVNIGTLSATIKAIAIAMLGLAVAVRMLADLDTKSIVQATAVVSILLWEVVGVIKVLSATEGKVTKGVGKVIAIAIAIDLLAIAVKKLGDLDFVTLLKGLAGVGALLFELGLFAKLLESGNLSKVGVSIILISVAMNIMAIAVKNLGGIPFIDMIKGLAGLEAILLILSEYVNNMDMVRFSEIAKSTLVLSAALWVLSKAIIGLGSLNTIDLVKGLGAVLALLFAFSKFLTTYDMTSKALSLGAGMVLIGIGLNAMIVPIKVLGGMDLPNLAKGLGAVAVMLTELGIFAKLVDGAKLITISLGLLIFSAALIPFATAMGMLSLLGWEGIAVGLVAIAGALTVLGVASAILAPAIVPMLGVGAALLLLGTAALAAGVGMLAITTALINLAAFGVVGVTALGATLAAMAGLIPTVVAMLKQLGIELLTAAMELIPLFVEVMYTILDSILKTIADHIPSLVDSGCRIVIGLLKGIAEKLPDILEAAGDLIANFLIGLSTQIPKVVDAGIKMIISFIEGMAQAIRDNAVSMINAVNELMESIIFAIGAWIGNFINGGANITGALIEGIRSVGGPAAEFADMLDETIKKVKEKISDIIQAGKDYINGFINAIKGGTDEAEQAGADLGAAAEDGLRGSNGIDAHSDSHKTIEAGHDFTGGLVTGIEDGEYDAYNAGALLGQSATQGTKDGLEGSYAFLDNWTNKISKLNGKAADSGKDVNAMKQEQLAVRKANKEAAEEETTALELNTEATGKNGSASKKAADDVKDLSDAFKTVERGAKVNFGNMINSLAENYQETARWAKDMKTLMGKGFDKSITDWIKKMGVGGHETVKAFMNASEEEVNVLNTAMKSYLTIDDDAEKYILGKYDEFGAKIAEVLSDSVQTYSTKLAETIQDAIDPFKEFDKKTELTGDKMLANMRSQISGVTEWSDNVTSLMGRVPEELIQYFQDLGPASYEEVNAMAHMTEGQLTEAVELWNTQIELGKMLAIQQAQKYREVGQAVTDGLEDGIDFDKPYQDGAEIGDNIIDGTKDKLDSHSPSRVFLQIGKDTVQGLVNGIKVTGHIPVNEMIIVCTNVMNEASRVLSFQAGQTIGSNLTAGIAQGIRDGESGVINQAVATAVAAYEAAKRALDINSPSKLFRKLGLSMDEGWAQGIDAGTGMVTSATQRMADNTVQMMNDIIKNISETVNDSPEFQPVIRPELDLTALQNGKSKINEMLKTSPAASLRDRMFAKMDSPIKVNNPNVGSTTVINNYNQTNNSPKSLDTYEIYRQSRNLFNMVKGANI